MIKTVKAFKFRFALLFAVPFILVTLIKAWSWLDLGGERKVARLDTRTQSEVMSEFVMYEGANIEAEADGSRITIEATTPLNRNYRWQSCELSGDLYPRRTRWFGSMGGYNAGASFGISMGGCNGISRPVVQEGQIHFTDDMIADEWIRRRPTIYKSVWNLDGSLISWAIIPERSQLTVEVWQICKNGKPYSPKILPNDGSIKIIPNLDGASLRPCKSVDQEAIFQTVKQLQEFWNQNDEWNQRRKNMQK